MKHKSDDYKISSVKYYLKNKDNIRKTCKIVDCSKTSLHRWIDRYKTTKNITRKNRTPISYKINKDQVKTAVNMIDKNEQLTIDELLFAMKQKYKDLDISTRHLGRVIRASNRTMKRIRYQHYPKERRKQLTYKNIENF
jgi:transposase